jgi:hypothetical protein
VLDKGFWLRLFPSFYTRCFGMYCSLCFRLTRVMCSAVSQTTVVSLVGSSLLAFSFFLTSDVRRLTTVLTSIHCLVFKDRGSCLSAAAFRRDICYLITFAAFTSSSIFWLLCRLLLLSFLRQNSLYTIIQLLSTGITWYFFFFDFKRQQQLTIYHINRVIVKDTKL